MIEVEEVKVCVTEEDVLGIYAEYAGAIKNMQKLFVSALHDLRKKGVAIENARLNIEENEVYIRVNDVFMFHTEKTWAKKDGAY